MGFTPLLSATRRAQPDTMQGLLQAGAHWDVVSNGHETITDVLARAKTDTDEWRACEKIVKMWMDSSYGEMFSQHAFCKLLNIPTDQCSEFTGWLRSATDAVTLPVAQTRALILKAERDSEAIATLYRPSVPATTTASASRQYDLADLTSAVRRGDWRLVNGDYEWVESQSPSDEPAK